jgi:ABC-2 type transport system permease protein
MNTARIYFREQKFEFLRLLRTPMYAALTLFFPTLLYTLFGLLVRPPVPPVMILVAWSCYGVMGASLFGFGVSVAVERGMGWLELKQASPMPPAAYLVSKLGASLLFSAIIVLMLGALGMAAGGVRLSPMRLLQLDLVLVLGALPFCAMGLMVGYLGSPTSAPALANILYLPMAFASGLLFPVEALPAALRWVAPLLPPYHFSRLAHGAAGLAWDGRLLTHLSALVMFTAACLAIAAIAHRRGSANG